MIEVSETPAPAQPARPRLRILLV